MSQNNTLYVYGEDFFISIQETDDYIDEIYKMIEDYVSEVDKK